MPAVLLFRHPRDDGALLLSVAVIHRRASKRDSARDVIEGKVSLIEDIDLSSPHAAHLRIPQSMALIEVDAKFVPSSFDKLDQAWRKVLDRQQTTGPAIDQHRHTATQAFVNYPGRQTPAFTPPSQDERSAANPSL